MTDLKVPISSMGSEELNWSPVNPDMLSRREVQRQTGAYRAALVPEIAQWEGRLPAEVHADVDDATGALARVDGFASGRLGPNARMGGPMPTILLRTESASSSQIEQLTTSALQLALASIDETAKANATTVLGNVHAMETAIGMSGQMSLESILDMHRALLEGDRMMASEAGALREQQVWIGPGGSGPLLADFVPPAHHRVPPAMDDLVAFIAREDLPVLVQAAVAHAQFETIHPFADGNGRTGRALIHAILKEKGLVTTSVIPISAGLLTDIGAYFAALGAFRSGDAGPIIVQFTRAARFASHSGRQLMDELLTVLNEMEHALAGVRRDSSAWTLLPMLIAQPAVNLSFVAVALGTNQMTAMRAVDTLVDRGILREATGRRRNRIWQQPGVLSVLDAFADGARRGGL
ncbi:Fic family protein [Brevibacterium sp. RIT 803]|uniref:Fic family protein n=1 Tax=Brevibacterium sp. RIT 803 TaxID=2810210 RepID=UPI001950F7F4|nr:Fic family protein [Brevibacterium sp. RIT 803]MBM6591336.1 Fic family protein [Brevibacterium sp. RIT 803]